MYGIYNAKVLKISYPCSLNVSATSVTATKDIPPSRHNVYNGNTRKFKHIVST